MGPRSGRRVRLRSITSQMSACVAAELRTHDPAQISIAITRYRPALEAAVERLGDQGAIGFGVEGRWKEDDPAAINRELDGDGTTAATAGKDTRVFAKIRCGLVQCRAVSKARGKLGDVRGEGMILVGQLGARIPEPGQEVLLVAEAGRRGKPGVAPPAVTLRYVRVRDIRMGQAGDDAAASEKPFALTPAHL